MSKGANNSNTIMKPIWSVK